MFTPSTPMIDEMLRTAGSSINVCTSACCRSPIAVNEILCGALVMTEIAPVSCTGKKPFGTTQASNAVRTTVAVATIIVSV